MKRTELKIARIKKGMTQEEVANEIWTTQSWYSRIESGKCEPSLEMARLLMKLLDVKLSVF